MITGNGWRGGEKEGGKGKDQQGRTEDIGRKVPAEDNDPHHDPSRPQEGEPKITGGKPPEKKQDHQGAKGMARREGGMDMKMEGKENGPPRQRIVLEGPVGRKGGERALERMFQESPQHQEHRPQDQEGPVRFPPGSLPRSPSIDPDPAIEEEREFDLRVSRPAKDREKEINGRRKTNEELGDGAVERTGLAVKEEPDKSQKAQERRSR